MASRHGPTANMIRIFKSHSAYERITAAAEFVRSFPPATELLIIGGGRDAVDDFIRELATCPATFGLHRFSLSQLATRLARGRLAAKGIVPGTAVGAEAIAVRATYEAQAQQRLRYFSPVASFPGFARAATATLAELRAAGITAGDLERLGESGPDNATLLESFEQQMREASVADRTLLFREALEEVQRGADLVRHRLLFLDVPIHSQVERQFVTALAAASPEVLFTCPQGDLRTLSNLNGVGTADDGLGAPRGDSSLERLRLYLFSEELPPAGKVDDGVVFFSAPGEERECVEIARRVLAEARQGIPFDRMAILFRAPESYASLMESALARAGIPAYFAHGTRRPDPSGRALLALLACAAEGLSARRFAEYLSFAQVPNLADDGTPLEKAVPFVLPEDDALGPITAGRTGVVADGSAGEVDMPPDHPDKPELAGNLRAPWRWEQLMVKAAVIGGRQRWARRLDGLEHEFRVQLEAITEEEPGSPHIDDAERKLRNLRHLRAFALPVIDELAALPESATWGRWTTALERLVPKVLRRPERVLAVLADMKPMAPVDSVPLSEVRIVLEHWLANLQQEPPESRYGRVLVTTPEQARGRSFDVVFVPCLAERMFPQKLREDPLLLDQQRKNLASHLRLLNDRSQHERLLLQLAVGAARRRLYLSYPRLDVAEARPRVPSFYALDVARSITGNVPDHEVLAREAELLGSSRLAWPAPGEPSQAIDDSEYDLATVWPLLNREVPRAGRLAYILKLNSCLYRSLRSRWARWHKPWSVYDGLFSNRPSIAAILERYRLAARPYSVSGLQKFAACPYRFLLSEIYRLGPREEPAPLAQLDPLTRGRLFHRIQAKLQLALKHQGALPLKAEQLPGAMALLNRMVDSVASEAYEDLAPAIDRVWQDEIESMKTDLRIWLGKVAEQDGWVPVHFEFGFGLARNEERDAASLADPVLLPGGAKLRGAVDLIERSDDRSRWRITDHKTGKDFTGKGLVVGKGEYLQPVLYALAIEAAFERPVVEGRLFYCTTAGGFSERSIPLDGAARYSADVVLRTVDNAIAACFLVPAPREQACDFCDFQAVCGPYEQIRLGRKEEIPPLAQLKTMRELP
ncbi:MAG TPA: PD-(D/E)XK nuclease family protein [Terriglobales bacterium]|nr:PD-(D/E)XK nuclease family protein [Terriglobales bacterium]